MAPITIGSRTFKTPYRDELPALSDDEYNALERDIAVRGVIVPVVVDDADNIIDGHHRVMIAAELGLSDLPVEVRGGLSDEEKEDLAYSLNATRRQLTQREKHDQARKLHAKDWSLRRIARVLAVSHETVRRWTVTYVTPPPNGAMHHTLQKYVGNNGQSARAVGWICHLPEYPDGEYLAVFKLEVQTSAHGPDESMTSGTKRGIHRDALRPILDLLDLPVQAAAWSTDHVDDDGGWGDSVCKWLREDGAGFPRRRWNEAEDRAP